MISIKDRYKYPQCFGFQPDNDCLKLRIHCEKCNCKILCFENSTPEIQNEYLLKFKPKNLLEECLQQLHQQ